MQNLRETRAGHELNVSYEESLPFFSSDEATELGRALVASGLGVKDKRNNLRKQRSYGDRGVRKWVTDWRGPKALPVARRVRALGERIAAHLGCDPFEYCALQSYKPEDDYRRGMRAHTDSEQDPLSPIVGITIFPRDPSATRPLNMVSGERLTKDRVTRGPVDLAHEAAEEYARGRCSYGLGHGFIGGAHAAGAAAEHGIYSLGAGGHPPAEGGVEEERARGGKFGVVGCGIGMHDGLQHVGGRGGVEGRHQRGARE